MELQKQNTYAQAYGFASVGVNECTRARERRDALSVCERKRDIRGEIHRTRSNDGGSPERAGS